MKKYSLIIALFMALGALKAQAQVVEYSGTPQLPAGHQFVYQQIPAYVPMMQAYGNSLIPNGRVRCGTDLSVNSYARYKDGKWQGIDADFCSIFAQAIFGDSEKFELINVDRNGVSQALNSGTIDVMLSGAPSSAGFEISGGAINAGLLYYDYQMLMSRADDSDDLEDYKGKRICVSSDSEFFKTVDDYNKHYNLGMQYLQFNNSPAARQAFLLKRCELITSGKLELEGFNNIGKSDKKILMHKIALHPVYAYVQSNNNNLRLAVKWIINALYLAEQYDINAKNLEFHLATNSLELKNLFGINEKLWAELKVRPQWLKDVILKFGNFSDIFERNFGKDSAYPLERSEGNLLKNGGIIQPLPFI